MTEEVRETRDVSRKPQRTSTTGPVLAVILLVLMAAFLLDKRVSFAKDDSAVDDAPAFSGAAFLGGMDRRVTSLNFRGGEASAFMGGVKIDLRDAQIAGDEAVLELNSIMGGIHIRVPDTWVVVSHIDTVLGGFKDTTRPPIDGSKRLVLEGTVLMGGLKVSN